MIAQIYVQVAAILATTCIFERPPKASVAWTGRLEGILHVKSRGMICRGTSGVMLRSVHKPFISIDQNRAPDHSCWGKDSIPLHNSDTTGLSKGFKATPGQGGRLVTRDPYAGRGPSPFRRMFEQR